jgi:hypothetical protein
VVCRESPDAIEDAMLVEIGFSYEKAELAVIARTPIKGGVYGHARDKEIGHKWARGRVSGQAC